MSSLEHLLEVTVLVTVEPFTLGTTSALRLLLDRVLLDTGTTTSSASPSLVSASPDTDIDNTFANYCSCLASVSVRFIV